MTLRINWRAGLLSGLVVAVVGLGIFAIIGSSVDYACKNTTPGSAGCRVYLTINRGISAYSDVWRSAFAPRCVGGQGPDDCLGPDLAVMFSTLFVLGFISGNLIWRKKKGLEFHYKPTGRL